MVVAAPPRAALLRQSRLFLRTRSAPCRKASTTSDAVAKSKEAATKASGTISRFASAAGPAIASATQGMGGALRSVGGRTGRFVSFVDSLIPPTIYYSKVGLEMAKIVFRAQKMQLPSSVTFQQYYNPIISVLRQPSTWASRVGSGSYQSAVATVRGMDRKQWAVAGVTAAEVLGFFSVGEIIGRMKIVGYRGDTGHEDH